MVAPGNEQPTHPRAEDSEIDARCSDRIGHSLEKLPQLRARRHQRWRLGTGAHFRLNLARLSSICLGAERAAALEGCSGVHAEFTKQCSEGFSGVQVEFMKQCSGKGGGFFRTCVRSGKPQAWSMNCSCFIFCEHG